MARTRTTKKLAQRIDLNYFKRSTPLKRAKFWLSILLPVCAVVWIAWYTFRKDARVYSSGRMSEAHAVLETECAACHVQKAGVFSAKAEDNACLACHDGPVHHASEVPTPRCAECHAEHRGRVNLRATNDKACAECHGNLEGQTSSGLRYAAHIKNFAHDHPEFMALRDDLRDPTTLKLNHQIHMKLIRRGPNGPLVQLDCSDCHRPATAKGSWTYADAKYVDVTPSYSLEKKNAPRPSQIVAVTQILRLEQLSDLLQPHAAKTGRELMAPVKFATACASCHLLSFDKRFDGGVPHDKPEIIHTFLVKQFQEYIAAHPAEVRVARDPERDLTGKPILPEVRLLTPVQWVSERTAEAEELLWRKTCSQCHALNYAGGGALPQVNALAARRDATLPQVGPSKVISQWMPHAKFDHDAHGGFSCVSCHQTALTSTESSDVLLPGIATCKTCHAPGAEHAESRCFECHTYHDWAQRKEVTPKFTLPALRTGGR